MNNLWPEWWTVDWYSVADEKWYEGQAHYSFEVIVERVRDRIQGSDPTVEVAVETNTEWRQLLDSGKFIYRLRCIDTGEIIPGELFQ